MILLIQLQIRIELSIQQEEIEKKIDFSIKNILFFFMRGLIFLPELLLCWPLVLVELIYRSFIE